MDNKNLQVVRLCYIILAILFGAFIFISISYAPFESNESATELNREWFQKYSMIYVLLNFFISISIVVITFIQSSKMNVLRIVSFLMLLLVGIDLVPIINYTWEYFSTETKDLPWTIVLLIFHLYLFWVWENRVRELRGLKT
jgi:hypothetical protein